MMNEMNAQTARREMVERQIVARGVTDPLVRQAMEKVPREDFLPPELSNSAYLDMPLPIGEGQTISQPYIVAYMLEALMLKGGERVLEIGTGSGYAAAVLAEIASEVFTVERIEPLANDAAMTLHALNYHNVEVFCADGTMGLPEYAPYDAIIVAAGGPTIPESLKSQLKVGGCMVIPIGGSVDDQLLVRISRISESDYNQESIANVRFVPLVGREGWEASDKKAPL